MPFAADVTATANVVNRQAEGAGVCAVHHEGSKAAEPFTECLGEALKVKRLTLSSHVPKDSMISCATFAVLSMLILWCCR